MNLDIRDVRSEDIEPIKSIIANTWNRRGLLRMKTS
ncbi:acetyltransferase, GT family [Paenibacillus macerans]|uniref:GNAT family N-acetyltransferase n=1 Tax=Paenibacillus macerans TaxID=44252 RepID=A0A090Y593_PAEMA|nr:hypothetical protein DJ90_2859 [Paenibacillus macerans]SUA84714.1 acetyltransferase, GT family [Paenibacillus macerans]